jgi:hypothetical protein
MTRSRENARRESPSRSNTPGRDELVADIARREKALRAAPAQAPLRYSEPIKASTRSRDEFLTDADAAAVAQFVANGNSADMERRREPIRYSDPEPATNYPHHGHLAEYERAYANSQGWETWLAERLEEEREHVFEMVGQAMGELLDEEAKAHDAERNKLRDKLRDLEIALANAKADITNLRTLLLTNGKDAGRAPRGRPAAMAAAQRTEERQLNSDSTVRIRLRQKAAGASGDGRTGEARW